MQEVSNPEGFEGWAKARIKALLEEAGSIEAVLRLYQGGSGETAEFPGLAKMLQEFKGLNLPASNIQVHSSTDADQAKPNAPGAIPAFHDRKSTQVSKYDALLKAWAKTPGLGMNNDEVYALAKKVVKKCGDKNAVLTYIWGKRKKGTIEQRGTQLYLVLN